MKEFMNVSFPSTPCDEFRDKICSTPWPIWNTADDFHHQTYSNLVQRCFDDCVNDFTTKTLHNKEEGCVMRCVDKFMKSTERLGQRFQEQNASMMQSGQLPGSGR